MRLARTHLCPSLTVSLAWQDEMLEMVRLGCTSAAQIAAGASTAPCAALVHPGDPLPQAATRTRERVNLSSLLRAAFETYEPPPLHTHVYAKRG